MSAAKTKSSPINAAIDAATENALAAADSIKDSLEAAITAGGEQSKSGQAQVAQALEDAGLSGREDLRECLDVTTKSGDAYFAAALEFNDQLHASAKQGARLGAKAAKAMVACETAQQLTRTQTKLAQSGIASAVAQANSLGQTVLKAALEINTPIAEHMGAVYADFSSKTAA